MTGHVGEQQSRISLPAPLRQYQWDGVNFLLSAESALLADEMGLGKTVQTSVALRLAMRQPECNRALIVAPSSLRVNWEREIRHWAPELAVRRVIGNARDRAATYKLPVPVLIASYEQVRSDVGRLDASVHFDIVVLDEAQRIKNSGSGASLACKMLPRSVSWALTGTPVENTTDDLVSIYSYVKPQLVQAGMPRHMIHERIQPYFLRRRKQEVLGELPPIIIQDIPLELEGAQLDAYETVWASRERLVSANGLPASEAHLLAVITKLKQICNHDRESGESAKLDALQLIMENAQAATDKIIIFSQYVETLNWVAVRLSLPFGLFHGGMSEMERDRLLSEFEAEPGPRALLLSLRAGGVGLNLNAASMVVMFDHWWNPAVENQAIQRAHRFGRSVPLQVVRFLVEDTIEDRIAELLAQKEDLFRTYVDEAESWEPTLLTREELRRILQLSEVQTG